MADSHAARTLAAIAFGAFLFHSVAAHGEEITDGARDFITELAAQANTLLVDDSITPRERNDRVLGG